jgi:predicted MFS family arabinose efflux permease
VQGVGAISGVAIAMAADLTRDSQRTKAMAIIGSTIGAAFAISFVAAPSLEQWIGMSGIFATTGILALAAMAVAKWVVPDAPVKVHAPGEVAFMAVIRLPELVRLNVGIFVLHSVLMALFVVVPVALVRAGLPKAHHWWVYLGAMAAGFLLMLPGVMGRSAHRERRVFLVSVGVVGIAQVVLAAGLGSVAWMSAGLVIFFAGFNVLEARLPALVSRAAPREARGAATGVYSSVQFLGTFCGAAAGGAVAQHAGFMAVFAMCLALTGAWLAIAWNMGSAQAAPGARNESSAERKQPWPR